MSSKDFKAENITSDMKWHASAKVDAKGDISELKVENGTSALSNAYETYDAYKAADESTRLIGVEITQTDLATWSKAAGAGAGGA